MRFTRNILLVLVILGLTQSITAQVITGKVMDEFLKEPLLAVTIQILKNDETVNTTITNANGEFEVDLKGGDFLKASYIGYFDQMVKVQINKENVIILKEGNVIFCGPIIIKAKYKTATNYTVINQQELRSLSPQNPQKLYNNIPGLYMHAGALNTNRITIRGIGSRSPFSTTKIRAYLNDIPLTNGVGETNLEDLNLGIVDNINIYKGPSASRHGASLGGVIHYRTLIKKECTGKLKCSGTPPKRIN